MKKLISLILALLLCVSTVGCGKTNEDHEYILHLLEQEEYDMAIRVIEALRDEKGGAPAQTEAAPVSGEEVYEQTPESTCTDWIFHMDLINTTGRKLTLHAVLIINLMDGREMDAFEISGEELGRLPMGELVLEPDQGIGWDDGHPVTDGFNGREYRHVFVDEQGGEYLIRYLFDMHGMTAPEAAGPGDNGGGEQPGGDWHFAMTLENTGDTPWTLLSMDITDLMDGQQLGAYIFEGSDLANVGMDGLVLQPGERRNWNDGHPATTDWNGREYRFHFVDGAGEKQVLTFRFEDMETQNAPVDYSQDEGKDLKTLRHEAQFEQQVYDGVYWVPVATLGGSRYTNAQVNEMLAASPEEKQQNMSTLYEALQLYQVGNFTPSDDNVRQMENGVFWEHHKPGYYAVRSNTGCCATDSNWLHYILAGDYEEVGYLATSQRDGSGHVYNYIYHDGWYYFVDLTHYHASGSPMDSAVEDGDMNSYYATDFILGNLHRAKDFQSYVDYVQTTFSDPPGLMFRYTAENVLAVDGAQSQSGVEIIYEEAGGQPIEVIFDDPNDSLTVVRRPSPQSIPDWDSLC